MDADYKSITLHTYNLVAEAYGERDRGVTDESFYVKGALDGFVASLPENARVLDIGSGGGRDSRYLASRGLQVIGIDFSPEMVRLAAQESSDIDYKVMDAEAIDFPRNLFDGVWANASLHHIPKDAMPSALRHIKAILKPNGRLFIILKHGTGEGMRSNEKFGRTIDRYFAFYAPAELTELVERAGFTEIETEVCLHDEWLYLSAAS